MSGRPLRYAVVGKKKVLARRRAVVVECLGKLGIRMDAAAAWKKKQNNVDRQERKLPACGCSARRKNLRESQSASCWLLPSPRERPKEKAWKGKVLLCLAGVGKRLWRLVFCWIGGRVGKYVFGGERVLNEKDRGEETAKLRNASPKRAGIGLVPLANS